MVRFKKKSYWKYNVFWFSLQRLSEAFLILKRIEWDMIKMCIAVHVKYLLFLYILMKLVISGKIFERYFNIKFFGSLFGGSRVVPCWRTDGQTDRHDKANIRFMQFLLKASKNAWNCAFTLTHTHTHTHTNTHTHTHTLTHSHKRLFEAQ
jgi:hypothetical protein